VSREIIRVEPHSSYLGRYKAPASVMACHGNTPYVSGLPPFDPATGRRVRPSPATIYKLRGCLNLTQQVVLRRFAKRFCCSAAIAAFEFCLFRRGQCVAWLQHSRKKTDKRVFWSPPLCAGSSN